MKYKMIIFDMDGTILYTLDDLMLCTNHALETYGYPARTLEEIRQFVGNGVRKLIERAVPKNIELEEIDKVFEEFKVYYKEHCSDHTRPYDGICDLLNTLRKRGYMTAVVSNKIDYAVQDLVAEYFEGMFDIAIGDREGLRNKPESDSIDLILEKYQLEKHEVIYIGDSEVDIATAKNADIDSIIVEWGFRDREFLEAHGGKVFAKTTEDVLNYLQNIR